MRSPHLYDTMRYFCLGAFAAFHKDLDTGADLPFAFEEHGSYGRPTLYEYRPLVRGFIEARAERLFARDDVRQAVDDLLREPAARIFARAHEGLTHDEARALYRSVLVPLLVRTAEACGGFDWDDSAFNRAFAELEQSLYGEGHSYGAVAPLIGISCGTQIELGDGIRVRAAATGELAAMWPEASGLLPRDFGREIDRLCVLELERPLDKGADEAPDAPGELADAVTALRLATAAPVAAGPVLFERLDWRPYGIRPVLPIAACAPPLCSARPRRSAPTSSSASGRRRRISSAACSSPFCCTATAPGCSASSTAHCSAFAPVAIALQSCAQADTRTAVTSKAWRRRVRCCPGSSGSRPSTARTPSPASCSTSCGSSCVKSRRGRAGSATPERRQLRRCLQSMQ